MDKVNAIVDKMKNRKIDALFFPFCDFGEEQVVAAIASKFTVPILIWGPRDERPNTDEARGRDTQCGMFAATKVLQRYGLKSVSYTHLDVYKRQIIMCVTLASSQGVFLLVNYIRSVPRDLEEAAYIDGCGTVKAYVKIVLPMIRPILATIFVLNALWVWNDFQMPLLILNQSQDMWTLPLFQYNFKSQYSFDYNLAFASYLIAMIPVLIAYACAQKHIVSGLTQGAVKS